MASSNNEEWQQTKKNVLERNAHLFNNPDMSDIMINCGETEFFAHKHVLGMSSSVFHSMFFRESADLGSSIDVPDVDKESLKEFLHFLYRDKWSPSQTDLTLNIILEVMILADNYKIHALMDKCIEEVRRPQFFNPDNVFTNLETLLGFGEKLTSSFQKLLNSCWEKVDAKTEEASPFQKLLNSCWGKVDAKTEEAIKSEGFGKITQETLCLFLKRDNLKIEEIQLCDAVLKWAHRQCENHKIEATDENLRLVVGDAKYELRVGTMSQQEIEESGLVKLMTTEEREAVRGADDGSALEGWSADRKRFKFIRFTRFQNCHFKKSRPNKEKNKVHTLKFKVNKPVLFHGVRLLGTKDQSYQKEHTVTLKFNDKIVVNEQKYKSDVTSDGDLNGFDVLLDDGILTREKDGPSKRNMVEATITGPKTQYGINGERTLQKHEGIEVKIEECKLKGNKTNIKKGQFHQIFLSCS